MQSAVEDLDIDVPVALWSSIEYHGIKAIAIAQGPTISIRDPLDFSVISILHHHKHSVLSLDFASGNGVLASASSNLIAVHTPSEKGLKESSSEAPVNDLRWELIWELSLDNLNTKQVSLSAMGQALLLAGSAISVFQLNGDTNGKWTYTEVWADRKEEVSMCSFSPQSRVFATLNPADKKIVKVWRKYDVRQGGGVYGLLPLPQPAEVERFLWRPAYFETTVNAILILCTDGNAYLWVEPSMDKDLYCCASIQGVYSHYSTCSWMFSLQCSLSDEASPEEYRDQDPCDWIVIVEQDNLKLWCARGLDDSLKLSPDTFQSELAVQLQLDHISGPKARRLLSCSSYGYMRRTLSGKPVGIFLLIQRGDGAITSIEARFHSKKKASRIVRQAWWRPHISPIEAVVAHPSLPLVATFSWTENEGKKDTDSNLPTKGRILSEVLIWWAKENFVVSDTLTPAGGFYCDDSSPIVQISWLYRPEYRTTSDLPALLVVFQSGRIQIYRCSTSVTSQPLIQESVLPTPPTERSFVHAVSSVGEADESSTEFEVTLEPDPELGLGIVLDQILDYVVVSRFKVNLSNGQPLPAQKSGQIQLYDVFTGINRIDLTNRSLPEALAVVHALKKEKVMTLRFRRYHYVDQNPVILNITDVENFEKRSSKSINSADFFENPYRSSFEVPVHWGAFDQNKVQVRTQEWVLVGETQLTIRVDSLSIIPLKDSNSTQDGNPGIKDFLIVAVSKKDHSLLCWKFADADDNQKFEQVEAPAEAKGKSVSALHVYHTKDELQRSLLCVGNANGDFSIHRCKLSVTNGKKTITWEKVSCCSLSSYIKDIPSVKSRIDLSSGASSQTDVIFRKGQIPTTLYFEDPFHITCLRLSNFQTLAVSFASMKNTIMIFDGAKNPGEFAYDGNIRTTSPYGFTMFDWCPVDIYHIEPVLAACDAESVTLYSRGVPLATVSLIASETQQWSPFMTPVASFPASFDLSVQPTGLVVSAGQGCHSEADMIKGTNCTTHMPFVLFRWTDPESHLHETKSKGIMKRILRSMLRTPKGVKLDFSSASISRVTVDSLHAFLRFPLDYEPDFHPLRIITILMGGMACMKKSALDGNGSKSEPLLVVPKGIERCKTASATLSYLAKSLRRLTASVQAEFAFMNKKTGRSYETLLVDRYRFISSEDYEKMIENKYQGLALADLQILRLHFEKKVKASLANLKESPSRSKKSFDFSSVENDFLGEYSTATTLQLLALTNLLDSSSQLMNFLTCGGDKALDTFGTSFLIQYYMAKTIQDTFCDVIDKSSEKPTAPKISAVKIGIEDSTHPDVAFVPTPTHRPIQISSSAIVWALYSKNQAVLLQRVISQAPRWLHDVKDLWLGLWVKDSKILRDIVEKIAKAEYMANKDPLAVSLLYIAVGKKQILSGLFRLSTNPQWKQLSAFFLNNFSEERWQVAAIKNAYGLLRKKYYSVAAAMFLVHEPPKLYEASRIIINYLNDIPLALAVSRLMELQYPSLVSTPVNANASVQEETISPIGDTTKRILEEDVIYYARKETNDRFLESAALWWLQKGKDSIWCLHPLSLPTRTVPDKPQRTSDPTGQQEPSVMTGQSARQAEISKIYASCVSDINGFLNESSLPVLLQTIYSTAKSASKKPGDDVNNYPSLEEISLSRDTLGHFYFRKGLLDAALEQFNVAETMMLNYKETDLPVPNSSATKATNGELGNALPSSKSISSSSDGGQTSLSSSSATGGDLFASSIFDSFGSGPPTPAPRRVSVDSVGSDLMISDDPQEGASQSSSSGNLLQESPASDTQSSSALELNGQVWNRPAEHVPFWRSVQRDLKVFSIAGRLLQILITRVPSLPLSLSKQVIDVNLDSATFLSVMRREVVRVVDVYSIEKEDILRQCLDILEPKRSSHVLVYYLLLKELSQEAEANCFLINLTHRILQICEHLAPGRSLSAQDVHELLALILQLEICLEWMFQERSTLGQNMMMSVEIFISIRKGLVILATVSNNWSLFNLLFESVPKLEDFILPNTDEETGGLKHPSESPNYRFFQTLVEALGQEWWKPHISLSLFRASDALFEKAFSPDLPSLYESVLKLLLLKTFTSQHVILLEKLQKTLANAIDLSGESIEIETGTSPRIIMQYFSPSGIIINDNMKGIRRWSSTIESQLRERLERLAREMKPVWKVQKSHAISQALFRRLSNYGTALLNNTNTTEANGEESRPQSKPNRPALLQRRSSVDILEDLMADSSIDKSIDHVIDEDLAILLRMQDPTSGVLQITQKLRKDNHVIIRCFRLGDASRWLTSNGIDSNPVDAWSRMKRFEASGQVRHLNKTRHDSKKSSSSSGDIRQGIDESKLDLAELYCFVHPWEVEATDNVTNLIYSGKAQSDIQLGWDWYCEVSSKIGATSSREIFKNDASFKLWLEMRGDGWLIAASTTLRATTTAPSRWMGRTEALYAQADAQKIEAIKNARKYVGTPPQSSKSLSSKLSSFRPSAALASAGSPFATLKKTADILFQPQPAAPAKSETKVDVISDITYLRNISDHLRSNMLFRRLGLTHRFLCCIDVQLMEATNLISTNVFSSMSNPYAFIELGKSQANKLPKIWTLRTYRSRAINNSVSPTWGTHEDVFSFRFPIPLGPGNMKCHLSTGQSVTDSFGLYDFGPPTSVVIHLYSKSTLTEDAFLGKAIVKLHTLGELHPIDINVPLKDVASGSVRVKVTMRFLLMGLMSKEASEQMLMNKSIAADTLEETIDATPSG